MNFKLAKACALAVYCAKYCQKEVFPDMMTLHNEGIFIENGRRFLSPAEAGISAAEARKNSLSYRILKAHDSSEIEGQMKIRFDALISHDITYVGIIQTARASGMTEFPLPYALTNCHNSLCAVGGTINEDDHMFGLSAARKYGGIYVPANQAVIHQYAREELAGCGRMILGSDSHTRYGCYGTIAIGEGGPELVKQLLENTYDIPVPEVVLVYLSGKPGKGVGPHDVAIALCKAVFQNGFVKNRILEFCGPGIASLSTDFRIGIDVMTTETACLSSIWETDECVKAYFENHGRPEAYQRLIPEGISYYDRWIDLDLSRIEPMIALPFHPSNAYTLREFKANAKEILAGVEAEAKRLFGEKEGFSLQDKVDCEGRVHIDQGVIAGCAGGMYENLREAADILRGKSIGDDRFSLDVYPSSVPVSLDLMRKGITADLLSAGAIVKPCFCGPCFGAGDVPAHSGLSIRHTTRNFPNREGSKPDQGQIALVALMDARSIAATAANGGILTGADEIDYELSSAPYSFDASVYSKRCYDGWGHPQPETELTLGPNITDWPAFTAPKENLLLGFAAVIEDEVTTTDELIPSGETSSYRSNPLKLSEFTLSRREPLYRERSKAFRALESSLQEGMLPEEVINTLSHLSDKPEELAGTTSVGSCLFAKKPGDGSAREQAASCQKVLGGWANLCYEYATKRYRSNCINWGIFPFTIDRDTTCRFENGDYLFIPGLRSAVLAKQEQIPAVVLHENACCPITLQLSALTDTEREILLDGCLMNYYRSGKESK